jgi:hypothetical protein
MQCTRSSKAGLDNMDDVHWLTRAEAANLLECSIALVRKLEARGRLHPRLEQRGGTRVYVFARSEVIALARERAARNGVRQRKRPIVESETGEQAAEVFKLFAAGRPIEEIVILTRCSPSRVRALYLEFITPIGQPSPTDVVRAREMLERAMQGLSAVGDGFKGNGRPR